jgi:UDP-glucose 4-epimerase
MTKILKAIVTGGAGFIGSHIVDSLIDRRIETYVIDNFTTGSLDNLARHANNKLIHIVKGDIKDIHKLMPEIKGVNVFFHQAAIASIVASIENPLFVNDVNVTSTLEAADYCRKQDIKRFVFASSAAVYGVVRDVAVSEDLLCRPAMPYGAGKLACENYLQAYHSKYILCIRLLASV